MSLLQHVAVIALRTLEEHDIEAAGYVIAQAKHDSRGLSALVDMFSLGRQSAQVLTVFELQHLMSLLIDNLKDEIQKLKADEPGLDFETRGSRKKLPEPLASLICAPTSTPRVAPKSIYPAGPSDSAESSAQDKQVRPVEIIRRDGSFENKYLEVKIRNGVLSGVIVYDPVFSIYERLKRLPLAGISPLLNKNLDVIKRELEQDNR